MFRLRGKVLQYGREALINEGFFETHTPKIVATATEGGTDLFPMKYFDIPANRTTDELKSSIEKFASLTYEDRTKMGVNARKKAELEFDERIVINKYMEIFND